MRIIFLLLLTSVCSWSQEHHDEHSMGEHHREYKHSIALMLGHSHIFQGRDQEGAKVLNLPSIAIDYNYELSVSWSIGLHNDLIFDTFFVDRHLSSGDEEVLEREYPVTSVLMVGYRLKHFWLLGVGFGGEFAAGENLLVTRIGTEFEFPLSAHGWELITGINYDIKWDAYDVWNLTLGVAKKF
ncbi:hypothetical protein [Robertkochia aurantiaca]|uniref:hypothetical protein n=1 Tax=Robertkochia aurantiaca TaxID=2873700 RepID=UPI001CCA09AC|nr:hypothetical protein [Robertkochia sp. 3YJGBD-33]